MRVHDRLVRARSAGVAIVQEAERRGTEIIVIGTPRKTLTRSQKAVFGNTVDYVLRHAPCRVLVAASRGGGGGVIWYRRSIYVFSVLFVVIGLALLVVTAVNGGGLTGFLLGALFVALGVGRIQLERKRGA